MDWFQSLDPTLGQLLFGGAQNFVGGMAASIVSDLLKAGGYAARKAFGKGPRLEALHRAVGHALHATAAAVAGEDVRLRDDTLARLKELTGNEVVAGELAGLLLPQPRVPDFAAMRQAVRAEHYDPDPADHAVTLEELWQLFTREFYDAASLEPELDGALQIQALKEIAKTLGRVEGAAERGASSLERIADAVAPDPGPALRRYLEYLAGRTRHLPLLGRDPGAADAQGRSGATCLADVYIALDTTASARQSKPIQSRPRANVRVTLDVRPLSVAAAFVRTRRMVLLGDPGGGKSTFVNHLVYCLACAQMGTDPEAAERLSALPKEWPGLLPVRVLLREMAAWARGREREAEGVGLLHDYLRWWMAKAGLEDAFEPVWEALRSGGAVLFLDGWDEVSESDAAHPRIRGMLEALPEGLARCPMLLTCRVRSYEEVRRKRDRPEAPWRLDPERWPEYRLRELDAEKRNGFVEAWYAQLTRRENIQDAPGRAGKLKRAIQRPDLRRMAGNPLLLTMMAIDHADKGELPDARSVVYEHIVELLLWKWRRVEKEEEQSGPSLLELLRAGNWQERDLRGVLARLAFEAHATGAGIDDEAAEIPELELRRSFLELAPSGAEDWSGAEALLKLVRLNAGLLVPAGSETYAFPHRTFQEYLAACHVCNQGDVVRGLAGLARLGATWREVILLAINRLVHQVGETPRPFAVVRELCPSGAPPAVDDEQGWRDAAMAAECLAEIGTARARSGDEKELVQRVRGHVVALLEGGRLDVPARVRTGSVLGALGDPRDLGEMVLVPAGAFRMGEPGGEDNPERAVFLDAFRIRKYPVTNGEYAKFVQARGHPAPDDWGADVPSLELLNHPVVNVSWYDARAYCAWAGVSLPTEAQWEKAARGTDGRVYPWGNGWDPARCRCSGEDYDDAEGTAPVGSFPEGASPYGCLDVAGNVWEWCADWYAEDYYRSAPDRNPPGPDEGKGRVLRGGAWFDYLPVYFRSADRLRNLPGNRFIFVGFRCVAPADAG